MTTNLQANCVVSSVKGCFISSMLRASAACITHLSWTHTCCLADHLPSPFMALWGSLGDPCGNVCGTCQRGASAAFCALQFTEAASSDSTLRNWWLRCWCTCAMQGSLVPGSRRDRTLTNRRTLMQLHNCSILVLYTPASLRLHALHVCCVRMTVPFCAPCQGWFFVGGAAPDMNCACLCRYVYVVCCASGVQAVIMVNACMLVCSLSQGAVAVHRLLWHCACTQRAEGLTQSQLCAEE